MGDRQEPKGATVGLDSAAFDWSAENAAAHIMARIETCFMAGFGCRQDKATGRVVARTHAAETRFAGAAVSKYNQGPCANVEILRCSTAGQQGVQRLRS